MSTFKSGDWADNLLQAGSEMPEDAATYTTGNNWGLDGFQFDTPYNEGVEDSARLPASRGLSELPDGFVRTAEPELDARKLTETDDGINLTGMLSEVEGGLPKDASVMDLEWLDPTQEPDKDRLPDNEASLNSVSQLEEIWNQPGRKAEFNRIPARDKEAADYEASLSAPPKSVDPQKFRDAAYRAVRRVHYGHVMADIRRELVATLGRDAAQLRDLVAHLEEERGLLGNVFIRAVAFPGLKNGRWAKELRHRARTARYVVTDDPAVAEKLGLKMVAEVPWKKALAHYAPRLVAAGYRIPTGGNPRNTLRHAFLVGPAAKPVEPTLKPVIKPVIATEAEVRVALAAATPGADRAEVTEKLIRAKFEVDLVRAVRAGQLTVKEARRVATQNKPAADLRRLLATAVSLAGERRQVAYKANPTRPYAGPKMVEAPLSRGENVPKATPALTTAMRLARDTGIRVGEFTALAGWLRQKLSEGAAGKELDQFLMGRFNPRLLRAATPLLREIRTLHEGLSGHLYVDAGAYSLANGCAEGVLRHRANQLKYVLAAEHCSGCVHRNADGVCARYNKVLANRPPVSNPAAYQKKAIQMADASDAEVTASLFDPAEYNLRATAVEDVDISEMATPRKLGEILFGEGLQL